MSIVDEIRHRQTEGRLHAISPQAPGSSTIRALFVTTEIKGLLEGPWQTEDEEIRYANLQADFEVFVEGRLIDPKYLYWLSPKDEYVFEIRSLRPDPSIRVLGKFAERDVFVATNYALRSELGAWESREWRDAKVACSTHWRNLFHTYKPMEGSQLQDFVTNAADGKYFK